MSYGRLTVGDIRKAIDGLPDDSPVLFRPNNRVEFQSHLDKGDKLPKWAVPWHYNTREGHNAYKANDDRYDQNQVLLIELAGLSE